MSETSALFPKLANSAHQPADVDFESVNHELLWSSEFQIYYLWLIWSSLPWLPPSPCTAFNDVGI